MKRIDVAREIAFIPQESSFGFEFTCAEVVEMGRYAHGSSDNTLLKSMMEMTGTWDLRKRNIMDISGGERQRIILARAFVQEPHLLLLDEPTSHLDIHFQSAFLQISQTIAKQFQCGIITVFHDLTLAAMFSNTVLLMHEGKIIAQGTPEEVMTEECLSQAYGTNILVMQHPERRTPVITVR